MPAFVAATRAPALTPAMAPRPAGPARDGSTTRALAASCWPMAIFLRKIMEGFIFSEEEYDQLL